MLTNKYIEKEDNLNIFDLKKNNCLSRMNLPKELITNVNKYMYTNIETSKLQRTMRLKLFCFSHDLNYYKLTRSSFEDKYEG